MKHYTLQIFIEEGSDEFWEESTANGKTGCDEVVEVVKRALGDYGFDTDCNQVKLIKYEA